MTFRALTTILLLVPAFASAADPSVSAEPASSRIGCRRLAHRAYLACLGAEARLASSGIDVPATTCTIVMESVKRECRAERTGRDGTDLVVKAAATAPRGCEQAQAPAPDAAAGLR